MDDTQEHNAQESLGRAKSVMRLEIRAARRALSAEQRSAASAEIAARVLALPEVVGARSVMVYGASPEEADPAPLEDALRERGIRVAYPRIIDSSRMAIHWVAGRPELEVGPFGLLQPPSSAPEAPLSQLDAIVVPGVAFDLAGNRLGFGGGYYDLLLAESGAPFTVGIAYEEQLVGLVPHDQRDRPVDALVTPARTVRCATNRP